MMLFSRKKKIQNDRNAGLVFRWRGGYAGNTGGLTLAIILATSIFAIGILGFKVYVGSTMPPSRYSAEIINVTKIDPSLGWLLERTSPHLNPWHNNQNELGLTDVREKMYDAIDSTRKNQFQWNSVDFDETRLTTPKIYEQGEAIMPSVMRHLVASSNGENTLGELVHVNWYFKISSSDEKMIARLPEQKEYPVEIQLLKKYFGKTLRFSVNIDAKGNVVSSLPLDWNTDSEARLVESWVSTLHFKPEKASDQNIKSLLLNVTISGKVARK